MKVRIKTFDWKSLSYETSQACGFDFRASEDSIIKAGEFWLIETWTVIEVPDWYALQIQPRSSTFKNFWLIQTNSVGLIDKDYCWDNDTIKFSYLNVSKKDSIIKAGERIWQGIFIKIWIANFEVVKVMWNNNRGWFWTTWNK